MPFDFDRITPRKGTASLKYDFHERRGKPKDALPLWVADMDFPAPPAVLQALRARVGHGIFGYTQPGPEYFLTLKRWFSGRFGWEVEEDWLVRTPGVVFALSMAVRAFTKPGEAVLIQEPVYYPFSSVVHKNGRKLVVNQLAFDGERYSIDFDDFEGKIAAEGVKLFILCNPHNPVGRVWREEELLRLGEICKQHGVLVVADEIHQDFVYEGHRHLVFAALRPEFSSFSLTCTAPTKSFNLAGLQISNIFIPNGELRQAFAREIDATGYDEPSLMGVLACMAAYEQGGPWLDELKAYLKGNLEFLRAFLTKMPQTRLIEPEGSYLVWLDFRATGMEGEKLDRFVLEEAGLWLDAGEMFGKGGEGFQRVNIACPRALLQEALERLEAALRRL
ncbi:MAG: pyridoxal phosphate-dependent aminotransferase [Christensenellaceae bacterium]|nr:pyridoxal phosphate-dependent aminotransferase [Christensenellaceae bacterium]